MQAPPELSNSVTHAGEVGESALHEHDHVNLRGMIVFFVWFFIGLVLVHVAIYGLYKLYKHEAAKQSVPITGLTNEDVTRSIPPEPRLQPSIDHRTQEVEDMATMRARDLAEFRKRGWASETNDAVVIPQNIVDQLGQISQPKGAKQ